MEQATCGCVRRHTLTTDCTTSSMACLAENQRKMTWDVSCMSPEPVEIPGVYEHMHLLAGGVDLRVPAAGGPQQADPPEVAAVADALPRARPQLRHHLVEGQACGAAGLFGRRCKDQKVCAAGGASPLAYHHGASCGASGSTQAATSSGLWQGAGDRD